MTPNDNKDLALLIEKCTEQECGSRIRYSELTDDVNTHWHVKRGNAAFRLDSCAPPPLH